MPVLPAALQAKLLRRGILGSQPEQVAPAVEEEVFAENYDEIDYNDPNRQLMFEITRCPNKANKFHECSTYCRRRYGLQEFKPISERMLRKVDHMLERFPLPNDWKQVGDPETGRFYYWNMETEEVSWLPPDHPRSRITRSKETLIKLGQLQPSDSSGPPGIEDTSSALGGLHHVSEVPLPFAAEPPPARGASRESRRERRAKLREAKRRGEDELDPMDPASYSEAPRGTWKTGLEQKGDAKTGVDVTATGPLFQQRPYPSPGAILRLNKQSDDPTGKTKKPKMDP